MPDPAGDRRRPPLAELTLVRLKELSREPEAVFWIFIFPIVLAAILGLAFRSRPPEALPVAVVSGPHGGARMAALSSQPEIKPRPLDAAAARQALARGQVVLVVSADDPPVYAYDPTQPDSRAARLALDAALQRAAGRPDAFTPGRAEQTEPGTRYVDFLVPGLLGMNLMGTGMWGIAFSIVTARSRGLLKRLVATPMRKSHYLIGQMMGRMVFLIPEVVVLVVFAHFVFEVPVNGSILALTAVTALGALAFTGIGLLVAARPRTIEGVSGLMNFVMLPMWIFSGVFFSPSRFPDAMMPMIRLLPLTALNDALRAVMIDGAALSAVGRELAVVSAWGAAAFLAALRMFRWR